MADKEVRQERYDIELPQSIIESFARFLVPEIRKYYDSEQGQQEFAKWRRSKKTNNRKARGKAPSLDPCFSVVDITATP